MTRQFAALFFTAILLGATAKSALAQGFDGTLRGDVKDQSGALVPGAAVTVKNESTDLERSMESSSVGTFSFPNLLVGLYSLTVDAKGFQKYSLQFFLLTSENSRAIQRPLLGARFSVVGLIFNEPETKGNRRR